MQFTIDWSQKTMYKPIDKLQHTFLDFNQPMGSSDESKKSLD